MLIENQKLMEYLKTKDLAVSTLNKYYKICLWFADHYDIENPDSISEFMSITDRKYSERFAIKHLYAFLKKEKIYKLWAQNNRGKFSLKPRRQTRKHVTREQVRAIIEVLPLPFSLMARLQYEGGLRSGSLFKLMTTDLFKDDAGNNYIVLHEKGREDFVMYLLPETAERLWKYIDDRDKSEPSLFFPTYIQAYNRALRKTSEHIIGTKISSHWIRTSRVIHLLDAGVPFMIVSRVVCRHADPKTTIIYAKSAGVDTKALYQKYGGL